MNKVQLIRLTLVFVLFLSSCVPGEMPVENPGPSKDEALIQVDNDIHQTQTASVPTSAVTPGPTPTLFPGLGDEIICEGNWSNSAVQPPTLPAEYFADQNCLMEYFNSETSQGRTTTGTLPDGVTKVEFFDNVWVVRSENGPDLVFNPLIVNESGKPFGYPVIYEKTVNGKTVLMMTITDKDGTLIPGAGIEPAFQSASEIAAKYGYSDENGAVKRIGIAANGQIIVYGENDAVLAKLKYSASSPETIYPIPNLAVEVGRPDEALLFAAVYQFANAFGVNPEEVGDFTPQLLTGIDGKQFVVMTTGDLAATTGFDESDTPLLIAEQGENGEWIWSKVTLRKMGDKIGMPIGSFIEITDNKSVDISKEEFSVYLSNSLSQGYREKQQGALDFDWTDIQDRFAKENNMLPIMQSLVYTEPLPDWIKKGNFTNEQLTDILKKYIHDAMSHYPETQFGM